MCGGPTSPSRNMPEICSRPLVPDDAPALAGLYGDHFGRPWTAEEFRDLLMGPHVEGLGLLFEEDLVGFLIWSRVGDEAEIYTLFIQEDLRRQGLAARLLEEMEAYCGKKGVERIYLEVSVDNQRALSFYEKNHFNHLCIRKNYYKTKDGFYFDAKIMTKSLAGGVF